MMKFVNTRKPFRFSSCKSYPSQQLPFVFHSSSELKQQQHKYYNQSLLENHSQIIPGSQNNPFYLQQQLQTQKSFISKFQPNTNNSQQQKIVNTSTGTSITDLFPCSSFSNTHHHNSSVLIIHSNSSLFTSFSSSYSHCRRYFSQSLVAKNMHTFYEILLVPNNEGETTISFFTNGKRYLFNCSENLNRFCTECGVRIFSGLDHIFIPHISPTYLGGLPGAIITASELQPTNKIHLYGPPNLWHYLTSLRPFVKTSTNFRILLNQMMEHQLDQDYILHSDENLTVRGLLLKSDRASRGDYHSHLQHCDFGAPFVLRNSDGGYRRRTSSNVGQLSWEFLFSGKNHDHNNNKNSSSSSSSHSHNVDLSPMKKKQKKESDACYYSFKNRLNIQPVGEFEITQTDTLKEMLKHMYPTMADYCLCFLCKTADVAGKFDAEKAKQLGIVGVDRGRLVKGETIQVNGHTIKPEDIISPITPGSEVLIINCPNEHYLPSLLTNKHFEKYMSSVVSVIHCVPHRILTTPEYREFMDKFNKECDHVIVNEDSTKDASSFVSSCTNITEFSLVDKELFTQCLTPNYKNDSDSNRAQVIEQHPNSKVSYGESLTRYNLIPVRYRGLDNSKVSYIHKIDPETVEKTFYQTYPTIAKHLTEYKEKVAKESDLDQTAAHPQANILKRCSDEEFEIIFLGTGSSIPSKYRNVTGILLNLFDRGAILFDCGEGTLSQIYRACGKEKAETILKNLKCIWISHLHADHHLGLAHFLEERSELTNDKVVIVAQNRIKVALSEYICCSSDTKFAFDFVPMKNITPDTYSPDQILIDRVFAPLGLKSMVNVPVDHTCSEAHGIVVTHQKGWKVVFSGDTRPCQRLIDAGKDCTVLIHESTFEASLLQDAITKKHSCSFEAIQVGEKMNAYRTILTHFSQRYCKFPIVDSHDSDYAVKNVAVAHDLMRLNAKKLPKIPRVMELLKDFWSIIELDDSAFINNPISEDQVND